MYYYYYQYGLLVYVFIICFIILIIKTIIQYSIKYCCYKLTDESNNDNYHSYEDNNEIETVSENTSDITINIKNIDGINNDNNDNNDNNENDLPSYNDVYPNIK